MKYTVNYVKLTTKIITETFAEKAYGKGRVRYTDSQGSLEVNFWSFSKT